jgi:hypothetical protein
LNSLGAAAAAQALPSAGLLLLLTGVLPRVAVVAALAGVGIWGSERDACMSRRVRTGGELVTEAAVVVHHVLVWYT